jgi:hypothetical protein
MDQELLVESRIEDGQRLIDQLVRDGFPVRVAFWVKTSEEGDWFFFLGSPEVDFEKPGDAYGKVYVSLSKVPDCSISLSEIKLVNGTNPVARAAVALRDRHKGMVPTRFHGKRLGNLAVEEAYIYPPPDEPFRGLDEIKRQIPGFPGLDEIKRQFPSATVFRFYVLTKDVGLDSGIQPLRPFMGKINADEFEGRAPRTVYFLGPEASSGKSLASLVFIHRPEGWNTLFRQETQRWEEVRFAATGEPPYQAVDFAPLAAMKTDMKPHEDQIAHMRELMRQGYCITLPPDPTVIDRIPFTPNTRSDTLPPGVIDWEAIRRHIEEGGKVNLHKPSHVSS